MRAFTGRDAAAFTNWCRDPFALSRYPGTLWSVDVPDPVNQPSVVRVVEQYPMMDVPGGSGRTVYWIDTSTVSHPTRIETLDAQGHVVFVREYDDYRNLDSGVWRPFHVKRSWYAAGIAAPYLVEEVRIRRAVARDAAFASSQIALPQSETNWWYVHGP